MNKNQRYVSYILHQKINSGEFKIRNSATNEVADRIDAMLTDFVANLCDSVRSKGRNTIMHEDVIQEMSKVGYHL